MTDELVQTLSRAVSAGDVRGAATTVQRIIEASRTLARAGRWAELRPLADAADDVLTAARREGRLQTEPLRQLADLSQQVFAVLALVGDSAGVRDSGYFRAARAHAERLDAATGDRLRLLELVMLVPP